MRCGCYDPRILEPAGDPSRPHLFDLPLRLEDGGEEVRIRPGGVLLYLDGRTLSVVYHGAYLGEDLEGVPVVEVPHPVPRVGTHREESSQPIHRLPELGNVLQKHLPRDSGRLACDAYGVEDLALQTVAGPLVHDLLQTLRLPVAGVQPPLCLAVLANLGMLAVERPGRDAQPEDRPCEAAVAVEGLDYSSQDLLDGVVGGREHRYTASGLDHRPDACGEDVLGLASAWSPPDVGHPVGQYAVHRVPLLIGRLSALRIDRRGADDIQFGRREETAVAPVEIAHDGYEELHVRE